MHVVFGQLCPAMATKSSKKAKVTSPKKNYTELRSKAEQLYMDTTLNQKEIADILGITEVTVSKWANESTPTWQEIRALKSVGRPQALAKLYTRLIEQVEAKENSDSVYKTLLIIKELEDKRTALPDVINTMRDFSTFLMTEDLELAKKFIPYQSEFIKSKVNERK